MPIYEYECECGFRFEHIVPKADVKCRTAECKKCGKLASVLPSAPSGFKFSGSGFHRNDYPTVDQAVGESANKRWSEFHERKEQREKEGKKPDAVSHSMVVHGENGNVVSSFPVTEKSYGEIKNQFPARVPKE